MEKIKLTFLGTGAMIPNERRNHPAFLLEYKEENILIDCGEGTQIQFRKAKLNPCKVTKILITHWHGDHTFGLPGLLRTLETSGYKKKMFIYGPKGFKRHMEEMFIAFGKITEFKIEVVEASGKFFENSDFYIEAGKMIHVQPCNAYSFVFKDRTRIDKSKMKKLKLPQGKHMQDLKLGKDVVIGGKKFLTKNLVFKEKGKKISIILDTLMNYNAISLAKNSDLLICEASFAKQEEQLAKEYLHLTASQASEIAKKAKVKKLILTHISQRYDKTQEKVLGEAKKEFKNTALSKDLDVVYV